MSFEKITPGRHIPDDFNAIIEIPAHSDPVKYEIDKETGILFVDRFMSTSMHYPTNYGYIPQTLCEDGDPLDVLVLAPHPLLPGSGVRCRPIGVLQMTDEKGEDAKILAVPVEKLSSLYESIRSYKDLPSSLLNGISHFFEHYKDLEAGKWVKIGGWKDIEHARSEIISSVRRYQESV